MVEISPSNINKPHKLRPGQQQPEKKMLSNILFIFIYKKLKARNIIYVERSQNGGPGGGGGGGGWDLSTN